MKSMLIVALALTALTAEAVADDGVCSSLKVNTTISLTGFSVSITGANEETVNDGCYRILMEKAAKDAVLSYKCAVGRGSCAPVPPNPSGIILIGDDDE
ncbi:MAG: hypothetical protein OXI87_12400 [Albidovulum sp.]|nr:hypothetical protein [Albidovulum sp.]